MVFCCPILKGVKSYPTPIWNTNVKIHANHFSYDLENVVNGHFDILTIYLANEANPDFESYIPEWPEDERDDQKIIITSKCYFDIHLLSNGMSYDLIILAIDNFSEIDALEINELLVNLQPKNTVLLHRGDNSCQALNCIDSYIRYDDDLLKGIFALGYTVGNLCFYSNNLIGFDFSDFTETVCKYKHGIMYIIDHTTQVGNYEDLAQEALNDWVFKGVDTNSIAGLVSATNFRLKDIDFHMADFGKIMAKYQERFRALGIFPCNLFGVSMQQTSYQAYPFIQITMFGTTAQIKDNMDSHSYMENFEISDMSTLDVPAFLRQDRSEFIKLTK